MQVLNELRRLEDAQRRGDVDEAEVQKLRNDILSLVEDAEVAETGAPADADTSGAPKPMRLGSTIALVCIALLAFTALMAWLFNDLSMGITLGIAALAVVIIRAAQILEERDKDAPSAGLDDSLPE